MRSATALLPLLLLFTACDSSEAALDVSDPVLRNTGFEACPGARQIGILDAPNASCDLGNLPDGWVAQRLFEDASPVVAASTIPVPHGLRSYCAYSWEGAEAMTGQNVFELRAAIAQSADMSIETVAPDCRGIAPQTPLQEAGVSAALREAFHTNIGWIEPDALVGVSRTPVAVAIPDTVSAAVVNNPELEPANAHGLYMRQIIGDILCPAGGATCLDQISHTLAMPIDTWEDGSDYIRGGLHGTKGDIAMALYGAVAKWRADRVADPAAAPRLVINLSLGFDRELDDTTNPGAGPAKALRDALEYAACQGALVIAAAGNSDDPACPGVGPLAPASFEASMPTVTAQSCAAKGYAPLDPGTYAVFSQGGYAPVVHGVTGVDEQDRPLSVSRVDASPRIAALGSNAVAADASGAPDPLSGTSVSNAVVASTAALIWQFREDLRPDEVMQIIYDAGWDTQRSADVGLPGTNWSVRRVNVCAAVEAACAGETDCPALSCSASPPAADGNLDPVFDAIDVALSDPALVISEHAGSGSTEPVCEEDDANNLGDPQPDIPACSRCSIVVDDGGKEDTQDDVLTMAIDPDFVGYIDTASLMIEGSDGSLARYALDEAIVDDLNDDTVDAVQVSIAAPHDAQSASLLFELEGTRQSEPILIGK